MKTVFVDLVTKSGEIVRIQCPCKFEDELHESIENAMKRRDWWSRNQFDGCSMTYIGLMLDRVNMGEVVGSL